MSVSAEDIEDVSRLRPRWLTSFDSNSYVLTRFVFLRFLGLVYSVAFLVATNQLVPLVGRQGLEPAGRFLDDVRANLGVPDAFIRLPTLFWFGFSDGALRAVSLVGLALSL